MAAPMAFTSIHRVISKVDPTAKVCISSYQKHFRGVSSYIQLKRFQRRSNLECMQCSTFSQFSEARIRTEPVKSDLTKNFKSSLQSRKEETVDINCRTSVTDPNEHSKSDIGLFYTIDDNDHRKFFPGTINSLYEDQVKTFKDFSIMVRKPALEIISILKSWDFEKPMLNVILYGERGSGKSMTLAHVLHYGGRQGMVLLHIPFLLRWLRSYKPRESMESNTREGLYTIADACVKFLSYFQMLNKDFLENRTVSKKYDFSGFDTVEENATLAELIVFGMNRKKFADDVVGVLLDEIAAALEANEIKLMVQVEGINALWKHSNVKDPANKPAYLAAEKIQIVYLLKEFLKARHKNTVALHTVLEEINDDDKRDENTPLYLLGKEGFDFFDPFVPVKTELYSHVEAQSCIQYYIDNLWIQNPAARQVDGRRQLIFLSNRNPYQLMKLCNPL